MHLKNTNIQLYENIIEKKNLSHIQMPIWSICNTNWKKKIDIMIIITGWKSVWSIHTPCLASIPINHDNYHWNDFMMEYDRDILKNIIL